MFDSSSHLDPATLAARLANLEAIVAGIQLRLNTGSAVPESPFQTVLALIEARFDALQEQISAAFGTVELQSHHFTAEKNGWSSVKTEGLWLVKPGEESGGGPWRLCRTWRARDGELLVTGLCSTCERVDFLAAHHSSDICVPVTAPDGSVDIRIVALFTDGKKENHHCSSCAEAALPFTEGFWWIKVPMVPSGGLGWYIHKVWMSFERNELMASRLVLSASEIRENVPVSDLVNAQRIPISAVPAELL